MTKGSKTATTKSKSKTTTSKTAAAKTASRSTKTVSKPKTSVSKKAVSSKTVKPKKVSKPRKKRVKVLVLKKSSKIVLAIIGLVLGVTVIGSSYAWYQISRDTSNNINVTSADLLDVDYSNSTGSISMTDVMPITDSEAENETGYTISIKNNSGMTLSYNIYLNDDALDSGETRMDDNAIRYSLTNNNTFSANELSLVSSVTTNGLKSRTLLSSTIANGATVAYNLKLWLSSDATASAMNKVFKAKVKVVSSQIAQE